MDVDISLQALSIALESTLRLGAEKISWISSFQSSIYTSFMFFSAAGLAIRVYPETLIKISIAQDDHKTLATHFKEEFISALDELHYLSIAEIRLRCSTSEGPECSNGVNPSLESVDDLKTIASMFASYVLETAFRSIRSSDEALRFLSKKTLDLSDAIVPEGRMNWVCDQIIHTSRCVIVDICDGNFNRAPENGTFKSAFLSICHPDVYAVLSEDFLSWGPVNYFLIPVLIRVIFLSERTNMGFAS